MKNMKQSASKPHGAARNCKEATSTKPVKGKLTSPPPAPKKERKGKTMIKTPAKRKLFMEESELERPGALQNLNEFKFYKHETELAKPKAKRPKTNAITATLKKKRKDEESITFSGMKKDFLSKSFLPRKIKLTRKLIPLN